MGLYLEAVNIIDRKTRSRGEREIQLSLDLAFDLLLRLRFSAERHGELQGLPFA
jgi:hypothetical protein